MKTIVVYYSLEGNTKFIAERITELTGANVIRLEPKKEYPTEGFKKFFWGGKSVMFNEKPALLNEKIDFSQYDNVVIGTPIWASSFTPPILTFLTENKIENKNVFLFACSLGGSADKCFTKMINLLPGNKIVSKESFTEPFKEPKEDTEQKVVNFCRNIL